MKSSIITFILTLNTILVLASAWPHRPPPNKNIEDSFHKCIDHYTQTHVTDYYARNDANFTSILNSTAQNLRCLSDTRQKPLVIYRPLNDSEVQAAVRCAQWCRLSIRIRSGGHDYEGASYTTAQGKHGTPFMVLDLFNFKKVNIITSEKTAWVEAGVTTGQFYLAISKVSRNLAFPAGLCTSLGTGGHFSGGGYGTMMRMHGLAVDNVIDAKIVDAKGDILTRQTMGDDLFWAIRGGGGGNFAVVLAWKVQLVTVPDNVTVFSVTKTLESNATDVLYNWQVAAPNMDKRLFIRVLMLPVPAPAVVMNIYQGFFLGDSKTLVRLMNKGLPNLGLTLKDCTEMSWIESVLFIAQYPAGTTPDILAEGKPTFLNAMKAKSDFVREVIQKDALQGMWDVFKQDSGALMIWNLYGGRMNETAEDSSPFPHGTGVRFMIQYVVTWLDDTSGPAHMKWVDTMYNYMEPFVSKNPREAYVNYRDLDIGRDGGSNCSYPHIWGPKYFKNNFYRLVQVKSEVDPYEVFHSEQSIPTYWSVNRCRYIGN